MDAECRAGDAHGSEPGACLPDPHWRRADPDCPKDTAAAEPAVASTRAILSANADPKAVVSRRSAVSFNLIRPIYRHGGERDRTRAERGGPSAPEDRAA